MDQVFSGMVLSLGHKLESPGELLKLLQPRLHSRSILPGSLGVDSGINGFCKAVLLDSKMRPRVKSNSPKILHTKIPPHPDH